MNPFPQNEHVGDDDDEGEYSDHETSCPTQPTTEADYVPSVTTRVFGEAKNTNF